MVWTSTGWYPVENWFWVVLTFLLTVGSKGTPMRMCWRTPLAMRSWAVSKSRRWTERMALAERRIVSRQRARAPSRARCLAVKWSRAASASAVPADQPIQWHWWYLGLIGAIAALVFAFLFFRKLMQASEGDETMREIASHVREGANAYLRRQYRVVAVVFVVLFLILAFLAFGLHVQALWVPFAFLTGGFFS